MLYTQHKTATMAQTRFRSKTPLLCDSSPNADRSQSAAERLNLKRISQHIRKRAWLSLSPASRPSEMALWPCSVTPERRPSSGTHCLPLRAKISCSCSWRSSERGSEGGGLIWISSGCSSCWRCWQ